MHDSNLVARLTIAQLRGIFAGEIRDWADVGGPNRRIDFYNRDRESGTRHFIQEHVLDGEPFSRLARDVSSSALLVGAVSRSANAIGYSGVAYSPGSRVLRIAKDDSSHAVKPTAETVASGKYPLSRPLFYYVDPGSQSTELSSFLAWVLSPEGQEVVSFVGYFSPHGEPTAAASDTAARRPPVTAALGDNVVQLTPENMEQQGFRLAVAVARALRTDQRRVTIVFASTGRSIARIDGVTLRIGDDAEIPLALEDDLTLRFTMRTETIRRTTLHLTRKAEDDRSWVVRLADFTAL
ncbi:MAG: substrate-binding domain-containing protein [Planctomycetes bacterium]|nr:substrate-binding domain-containing protein [Planctomycetota bacterium]